MGKIVLVIIMLASLCWAGQHVVVSGEAVLARHNAAVETMADQLK